MEKMNATYQRLADYNRRRAAVLAERGEEEKAAQCLKTAEQWETARR